MTTISASRRESGPGQGELGYSVASVLICDERPVTRRALENRMKAISSVNSTTCVANSLELVDAFTKQVVDLVLIGHEAGRSAGLQATQLLLKSYPRAAILAFGSPSADAMLAASVTHGARGILVWDVRQIAHQEAGYDLALSSQVQRRPAQQIDKLSRRELQILGGMCQGRSNAEIGRTLFLSEDTIKTHARKLFVKLGANDRAHAVAQGMRNRVVA
jgi:DNA-binding NarL/FixJ family response regulator